MFRYRNVTTLKTIHSITSVRPRTYTRTHVRCVGPQVMFVLESIHYNTPAPGRTSIHYPNLIRTNTFTVNSITGYRDTWRFKHSILPLQLGSSSIFYFSTEAPRNPNSIRSTGVVAGGRRPSTAYDRPLPGRVADWGGQLGWHRGYEHTQTHPHHGHGAVEIQHKHTYIQRLNLPNVLVVSV